MKNLIDKIFLAFVKLVFVWTVLAISFDMFMVYAHFNNPELETKVGNWLTWHLDGTFYK
jgi:hypothetical protein